LFTPSPLPSPSRGEGINHKTVYYFLLRFPLPWRERVRERGDYI